MVNADQPAPPAGPATPTRRVVLLGASNLARGFPTVIERIRRLQQGPIEILAALGHGRSYGSTSHVLGRGLPGIVQCGLWKALADRPELPTSALVTDVGNDIVYGAPVATIAGWVETCLDRLAARGAHVTITLLPLANLEALTARRFRFFRALLYPRSRLSLEEAAARARELNDSLARIGSERSLAVVEPNRGWYGFDPIHIRRRSRRAAWSKILSSWAGAESFFDAAAAAAVDPLWRRLAYRAIAPERRWLLGVERRRAQPARRDADGTTISLY